MGRPAGRVGDMQSGHGCYPPTNAIRGTPRVKINGRPALNIGSQYQPHCCPKPGCHPVTQVSGSCTVTVGGAPASRIGDSCGCGGKTISGSGNVLIGG